MPLPSKRQSWPTRRGNLMPDPSDGVYFQTASSMRLQFRSNTTCRALAAPRADQRVLISFSDTSSTTIVVVPFMSPVTSSVTSYTHRSPGRTPARSPTCAGAAQIYPNVTSGTISNQLALMDGLPNPVWLCGLAALRPDGARSTNEVECRRSSHLSTARL